MQKDTREDKPMMQQDRSSKRKLIRESYIRIVLVTIISLATTNVCGFIDNIMISNSLGTEALAAVGYYAPLSVLSGLASVIILGAVVLCGNLMGSGQSDKVNSMFNSSFITILVVCSLISVILIVIRNPLSFILGARGDTQQMLADYILGYAPCIALSSLSSLLVSLAAYINETNRTYIAAAALLLGDIAFNAILVKPLGILGIGLASTISASYRCW